MAKACVFAIVCLAAAVAAQEPAAPAFEVASIRVNKTGQLNRLFSPQPGGRFNATNLPLRELILFAYQLRPFQVEGGPDWMNTTAFDIVAKAPGEVPPMVPGTESPYALMMRALLADRFRLVVRRETRDAQMYALTLARADGRLGPRLTPATVDCGALRKTGEKPPSPTACVARIGPNRIDLGAQSMDQLQNMLGVVLGRQVVNRTGLTGNFDLTLTYSPESIPGIPLPAGVKLPDPDPDAPSIFTALQEQAGLKVESTRGPVEMLVVERAEMPTED